jgi:hypothetical protein
MESEAAVAEFRENRLPPLQKVFQAVVHSADVCANGDLAKLREDAGNQGPLVASSRAAAGTALDLQIGLAGVRASFAIVTCRVKAEDVS